MPIELFSRSVKAQADTEKKKNQETENGFIWSKTFVLYQNICAPISWKMKTYMLNALFDNSYELTDYLLLRYIIKLLNLSCTVCV